MEVATSGRKKKSILEIKFLEKNVQTEKPV